MFTEKTNILCILDILEKYLDADRRTVYRNIDALIEFGYDISK